MIGIKEVNEKNLSVVEAKNSQKVGPCMINSRASFNVSSVPDSKSRNIPEVVIVRRWAVGVLGLWKGWDSWVKGGANRVSLRAT